MKKRPATSKTKKAGKKKLGIFYGAAHLPDMEQRVEAMGFKKVSAQWKVAWDMSGPPATRPALLATQPSTGTISPSEKESR